MSTSGYERSCGTRRAMETHYLYSMPIKTKIPTDSGHFFITFTCFNWLPLIEITSGYDLVYSWFDVLKEKGHHITGYVIMPNHVHATIAFKKIKKNINKIIGDGKRFIGYEIVKRLKEKNETALLNKLAAAVNNSDKAKGKLFEIWEDSFEWKECFGDEFSWQKINYMHNNPCSGKWQLCAEPALYPHSSAKFYLCGEQGVYPVLNFKMLSDFDFGISP